MNCSFSSAIIPVDNEACPTNQPTNQPANHIGMQSMHIYPIYRESWTPRVNKVREKLRHPIKREVRFVSKQRYFFSLLCKLSCSAGVVVSSSFGGRESTMALLVVRVFWGETRTHRGKNYSEVIFFLFCSSLIQFRVHPHQTIHSAVHTFSGPYFLSAVYTYILVLPWVDSQIRPTVKK